MRASAWGRFAPQPSAGGKVSHDRVERAQGLLAPHQGTDAHKPAAVRGRVDRATSLRRSAQQQARARHTAGVFPGLPRPDGDRSGDGSHVREPPGCHRPLARRPRRYLIAMAFTARTRLVNPRLGTYFGIFAAAFASLVLMAMMFEQLGTADMAVRLLMFAGPVCLFVAIGLLAAAREPSDYFVC